jgi:hypothetical protein
MTKMVELENHDSLIQPAACGQGIENMKKYYSMAIENGHLNTKNDKSK